MSPQPARTRNLTALEPLELALLPPDGLSFEEPIPVPWLREVFAPAPGAPRETALRPDEPGQLQLEVFALGPLDQRPPIRVRGTLSTVLTTSCVRCLEDVPIELRADVDLTLLPEASPGEPSYTGRQVELPDVIREALLLETEPNPVCADEPACDIRTRALLEEANRPAQEAAEAPDPRWAQLSTLLNREEG